MPATETASLHKDTVSNTEIVKRGWEAVGSGDWDALIADYTADMIFVMPGQDDVLKGRAAFRDVLEAQRDLDQAQVRLLSSKYTKIAAEITLSNLTGTIFQRHGISPELPTLD